MVVVVLGVTVLAAAAVQRVPRPSRNEQLAAAPS
jgi:hypothetical protein